MTEEPVDFALEGHPLPAKLSAYHVGELSAEEDDAIQEHLISCALCREALLDLERFINPSEEDLPREGVADLGAAAEWRELRGKIRIEKERKPPAERATQAAPRRKFLTSFKTAYALAAVLAAVALGLSLYVQSLRHELSAYGRNPHLVFLSSATVRDVAGTEKVLELPRGESGRVVITLQLPQGTSYPEYRVEIHRKEGRQIFAEKGLIPQQHEVLFGVSPELFDTGRYEITLRGAQQRELDPASRYELEVIRK